jgi:exoribonuclease-2
MFGVYDDSGKPVGGRILSEADATLQIELDSGKRVKVKAVQLLLRFDKPQPAELLRAAQALAQGFDLDLAWEFAPEGSSASRTWPATTSAARLRPSNWPAGWR